MHWDLVHNGALLFVFLEGEVGVLCSGENGYFKFVIQPGVLTLIFCSKRGLLLFFPHHQ